MLHGVDGCEFALRVRNCVEGYVKLLCMDSLFHPCAIELLYAIPYSILSIHYSTLCNCIVLCIEVED